MDRRDFGKALAAGAMGATAFDAGTAFSAARTQSAPTSDAPYRVLPDLKVRRLGDIHTGEIIILLSERAPPIRPVWTISGASMRAISPCAPAPTRPRKKWHNGPMPAFS